MKKAEFQLRGVADPRLAIHATSSLPAWLWSTDGTRILWANPVAARIFEARSGADLAERTFGPANPHRRQVIPLAHRLPPGGAVRLERLRGFGAPLGGLMTCACSRLEFSDGTSGVLIAATESSGRTMPLVERLKRLVEGIDTPIAAFARDGMFVGASAAARTLVGFSSLDDAGLDNARNDALRAGRVETPIGIGNLVLQRVGSGADIGLVALIEQRREEPAAEAAPATDTPDQAPRLAEDEVPATTAHEAPAAFALVDEFADPAPQADAPPRVTAAETVAPERTDEHEPSPLVEAVADEPEPPAETSIAREAPTFPVPAGDAMSAWFNAPQGQRTPMRFMWRMDADGRFSLGSDEFTRLIGARTAAAFGRPWREIAEAFALDPEGKINRAIATRETWSGVTLEWPVDGGARLPVELSGLPVYDRARQFVGYRGFGICRDLDALARLQSLRRHELFSDPPPAEAPPVPHSLSAEIASEPDGATRPDAATSKATEPMIEPTSQPAGPDTSEAPKNVLPFRPAGDGRSPSLTPVENNAFNELARQLAARLEAETGHLTSEPEPPTPEAPAADAEAAVAAPEHAEPADGKPGWLSAPTPPALGTALRDKTLLDLLPVGVLIYRLDRLLYANRAFLDRIGYDSLQALEEADGLDALFVEPVANSGTSTSQAGTAVTIAARPASTAHPSMPPTVARLYTISWDDESALALICSAAASEPAAAEPAIVEPVAATGPSAVGAANAEELGAILDTMADGILMFDAEGNINSCNRSAEALFGYDGSELTLRNLADLFAPESQRVVRDYLDGVKGTGAARPFESGRDVLGRVREGGLIALSMTMGRTRHDGPNFFAVFRDLSQTRKNEAELLQARRQADRSASAKADVLARISHEVRTPLNAIIGFAEVMIDERFGTLGNERYIEYMKDIRASGERVIAIINDLNDLSRIETGKIDLAFSSQNLNELVENCVSVMQPQANRERIIIRTSLAHMLPAVVADGRALRQITLNLIGNSIHLANAGGQVIVSTALSDFGDVVLRVRDTGHGMNDNEVAAAMEPFRTQGPADQTSEGAGISLSLTKALVEANRARFQIKSAPHSGTLIEVVFNQAAAARA
jgi:PAS domain S-box-containing protein